MSTVLDIDLDFFARPTVHDVPEAAPRPDDALFSVWSADAAADLLRRLGLTRPVPGRLCTHHYEALWAWNAAVYQGVLDVPFDVVHVDAHEDLGYGDPLWRRLQEEALARPVEERRFEEVAALAHSGNYLLCALALGWVRELTLVLPGPLAADSTRRLRELNAHPLHFRHGREASGALQLKAVPGMPADEQARRCRKLAWTVEDSPVPVRVLDAHEVTAATFDFLTVARSPAFCPPKTDQLLPLLCENLISSAHG